MTTVLTASIPAPATTVAVSDTTAIMVPDSTVAESATITIPMPATTLPGAVATVAVVWWPENSHPEAELQAYRRP